MSADVWTEDQPCATCGSKPEPLAVNITHNLSPMLRDAGFCGWVALIGQVAPAAGIHILAVLDHMATDPERWRARNPENGWGDYDRCLQGRLREFAQGCLQRPNATIGGFL